MFSVCSRVQKYFLRKINMFIKETCFCFSIQFHVIMDFLNISRMHRSYESFTTEFCCDSNAEIRLEEVL